MGKAHVDGRHNDTGRDEIDLIVALGELQHSYYRSSQSLCLFTNREKVLRHVTADETGTTFNQDIFHRYYCFFYSIVIVNVFLPQAILTLCSLESRWYMLDIG